MWHNAGVDNGDQAIRHPELFVFFWWHWDLNIKLTLARQALYHLNHSARLFFVGYFQNRVSQTICLGLDSNSTPPDLCLLSSLDYGHVTLAPGHPGCNL
jgi:hypothetical protein